MLQTIYTVETIVRNVFSKASIFIPPSAFMRGPAGQGRIYRTQAPALDTAG